MKKSFIYFFSLLTIFSVYSCGDLEEEVYNDTLSANFYETEDEILGAYMRPWAHLLFVQSYTLCKLQMLSTDMAAWTTKANSGHGYDGNVWYDLHTHTWGTNHSVIDGAWGDVWKGVAFCNNVIDGVESADFTGMTLSQTELISQMRALRALFYYYALDFWGNVPIVTEVGKPLYPETRSREEVYRFVEKELIDAIEGLPAKGKGITYGYFSKSAGYALLSRLYLNSEVFVGVQEYQKCLDACDAIEKLGNYQLDDQWQQPFAIDNDKSVENMFALINDNGSTWSIPMGMFTLHWAHNKTYEFPLSCWNGIVTLEKFYESYNEQDARRDQFLVGPQFEANGDPLMHREDLEYAEHVILSKELTTFRSVSHMEGARNLKYPLSVNANWNRMENDLVFIRYTEVLMNKAEALMRLNNGTASTESVALVNQIRKRAFGVNYEANKYTTSSLTLTELLAERGREFAYEGHRRTDLIRFGKYTDKRWEKETVSDDYRCLYPIPFNHIELNPNLKQNPGY